MYRSCIFCSSALGSNDSIERFPVGRSLAFDAVKGRLWAVCPKCARWNLAPIEERWEAIEDAERLFRDTRLRVQSENVGVAKLRDGTRLVRVGDVLSGEMAAWRYGRELLRRHTWRTWRARGHRAVEKGTEWMPALAMAAFGVVGVVAAVAAIPAEIGYARLRGRPAAAVIHTAPGLVLRRRHMLGAYLELAPEGGLLLHVPLAEARWVSLRGADAIAAIGRTLPALNVSGASQECLGRALAHLAAHPTASAFLDRAAERRASFGRSWDQAFWRTDHLTPRYWIVRAEREAIPRERALVWQRAMECETFLGGGPAALALEMALHEETERRALNGELAMLEGMWRDAEEIAAIADRLPDLPAPDAPRLTAEG